MHPRSRHGAGIERWRELRPTNACSPGARPRPSRWARPPGIADICIAGQIVLAEFNKIDLAAFSGRGGAWEALF